MAISAAPRRALTDVTVFERGGRRRCGCWRTATPIRAPPATCRRYLYSFTVRPERRDWSRRCAPQPEILDYLQRLSRRDRGVHLTACRLGTAVASPRCIDEAALTWARDAGRRRARRGFDALVVFACGQLSRPADARTFPGMDEFAGHRASTRRSWDHDGRRSPGQRVAVVGTGAACRSSSCPKIADGGRRACDLSTSGTAPCVILPRPTTASTRRGRRRAIRRAARACSGCRGGGPAWRSMASGDRQSRPAYPGLLALFAAGGGRAGTWCARSRPRSRTARGGSKPDYPIGCKRVLVSDDYYQALVQPNVELVTEAVQSVTAKGVKTADGAEHACDVLIYGTGFITTDFISPVEITGRAGRTINQAWKDGAGGLSGHDRRRIPQPVPALRPEHQPRPQLDHRHDRGPGRLRGRRAAPPGRAAPPRSTCAPRSSAPPARSCSAGCATRCGRAVAAGTAKAATAAS